MKHHWTDEEIHYLTQHYPIHGSQYIRDKYPHLSIRQIQCKARRLELKCKWTPKEIVALRMNYGKISIDQLKALLPKRSISSIRHKASSCGICTEKGKKKFHKKVHYWTLEELNAVRQYYYEGGTVKIRELFPYLSKDAIMQKAHDLGLHIKDTRWTEEEKNVIRNNYWQGYRKIMEMLPNRTKSAIITIAGKMNCTHWGHKNSHSYRPSRAQIERMKMEIRQKNYGHLMTGT